MQGDKKQMDTEEIKDKIIEMIMGIEDKKILKYFYIFIKERLEL